MNCKQCGKYTYVDFELNFCDECREYLKNGTNVNSIDFESTYRKFLSSYSLKYPFNSILDGELVFQNIQFMGSEYNLTWSELEFIYGLQIIIKQSIDILTYEKENNYISFTPKNHDKISEYLSILAATLAAYGARLYKMAEFVRSEHPNLQWESAYSVLIAFAVAYPENYNEELKQVYLEQSRLVAEYSLLQLQSTNINFHNMITIEEALVLKESHIDKINWLLVAYADGGLVLDAYQKNRNNNILFF